jgi:threonine synthase
VAATIGRIWQETGYALDPHTAVASCVYEKLKGDDETKTLIVATASPYKFLGSVMAALGHEDKSSDDFAMIERFHELCGVAVPQAIAEIEALPVRHKTICETGEMLQTVANFLEV